MKLIIECSIGSNQFYWIDIDDNQFISEDKDIAKFIGIPVEQYQKELLQFIDNNHCYIGSDIVFYKKMKLKKL